MEMEANNDLLGVISTYSTAPVVFELLTSFLPARVYSSAVWKQKAIVESRGLMMDDSIVEAIGDGSWYRYYLIKNKTYYGDVLRINVHHIVTRPIPDRHDIVYHQVVYFDDKSHITITQYGNLDIKISNKRLPSIGRRIREVFPYGSFPHKLLLADEYGDVWLWTQGSGVGLESFMLDRGIISINTFDAYDLFLTREGNILTIDVKDAVVGVPLPKIVEMYTAYKNPNIYVLLPAGEMMYISKDIGGIILMPLPEDDDDDLVFISGAILVTKSMEITMDKRRIQYEGLAFATADRTGHLSNYTTSTTELEGTRHRFQRFIPDRTRSGIKAATSAIIDSDPALLK